MRHPNSLLRHLPWLLLSVISTQAGATEDAGWSLHALLNNIAAIETRTSRFRETKEMAILDVSLVQTGTLHFQAPDTLSKRLDPPDSSAFEIVGDTLTVHSASQPPQVLSMGSHPQLLALLEPFRAVLAGDLAALQRHFEVALEGENSAWKIELKPRDNAIARRISSIEVYGAGADIDRFVVLEQLGDRTTTDIESAGE